MRNEGEEAVIEQSNDHSAALEEAAIVYLDFTASSPAPDNRSQSLPPSPNTTR